MNILIFYRHFPVAMGRYIHWGLEQAGHTVMSVGPYYGTSIPWNDGMKLPYDFPPHIETPNIEEYEAQVVIDKAREIGFRPALLIQAADTYHLTGETDIQNILIGTDPHVINYNPFLTHVDKYFSMQKTYSQPNDGWMPYGFDPDIHYWDPSLDSKKFNVCLQGLQYGHRLACLRKMSEEGLKVSNGLGLAYDQYMEFYHKGKIAFNWSSREDLPARFWEGIAMNRLMLTNRVPELNYIDLKEDVHFVAFSSIDEAVEKAKFYVKNPDKAELIAKTGYDAVQNDTYANRVIKMLEEI